jgi:endo-1,4-beta-xylanase
MIEYGHKSSRLMIGCALTLVVVLHAGLIAKPAEKPGFLARPAEEPTLKEAFAGSFLIGAAVNRFHFEERNPNLAALIKTQFNTITAENTLKWEPIHPRPNTYSFDAADRFVAFGEKNAMAIIGHALVWHHQTPKWVFENDSGGPCDAETLLNRMRDHILTVVGRYKGRIKGWDVVNEALNDDGTLRQSPWMNIIGKDYIRKAFEFAHQADPQTELYYNDYDLELKAKREGALRLIKELRSEGIPIAAVGLQGHCSLRWPTLKDEDAAIGDFAKLGIKVAITELDVDVLPAATSHGADISTRITVRPELNPYDKGLPDSVQQALAKRYSDLFRVFLKHRNAITRVTFWGVTDRDSWLNNWPVVGRTSYPLLFDREGHPKPALEAVVGSASR